jgi:hypothetical protein
VSNFEKKISFDLIVIIPKPGIDSSENLRNVWMMEENEPVKEMQIKRRISCEYPTDLNLSRMVRRKKLHKNRNCKYKRI